MSELSIENFTLTSFYLGVVSRIVNFRVAVVSVAAASLCIDVVRRHVAVVHRRGAAIVVCCVES